MQNVLLFPLSSPFSTHRSLSTESPAEMSKWLDQMRTAWAQSDLEIYKNPICLTLIIRLCLLILPILLGMTLLNRVHGVNRLGANSLLDIVVFGRACANRLAEIQRPGEKQKPLEKDAGEKTIAWLGKIRNSNGSIPTSQI